MQFKSAPAASITEAAGTRGYRPQWRNEWLANHSKYVLLYCGHKECIASADKTICLIQTFNDLEMYCVQCDSFFPIRQSLTGYEYLGITPDHSIEPLF